MPVRNKKEQKYYNLCPIIVVEFSIWNLYADVSIIIGQKVQPKIEAFFWLFKKQVLILLSYVNKEES